MKRFDTWKFATALALTLAILSGFCALAVAVAPDATIAVFNSWMHGVDLAKLVPPGGRPVTLGQAIAGILSLGIIGFVAGALLTGMYNAMTSGDDAKGIEGHSAA